MTTCWIIVRYDHQCTIIDPYIVGAYSTKKKAINKIIELIGQEYNNCNKNVLMEFAETWFEFFRTDDNLDEVPSWTDCKTIIKKNFKTTKNTNYYEGFVFTYKIMKKNFDD